MQRNPPLGSKSEQGKRLFPDAADNHYRAVDAGGLRTNARNNSELIVRLINNSDEIVVNYS